MGISEPSDYMPRRMSSQTAKVAIVFDFAKTLYLYQHVCQWITLLKTPHLHVNNNYVNLLS